MARPCNNFIFIGQIRYKLLDSYTIHHIFPFKWGFLVACERSQISKNILQVAVLSFLTFFWSPLFATVFTTYNWCVYSSQSKRDFTTSFMVGLLLLSSARHDTSVVIMIITWLVWKCLRSLASTILLASPVAKASFTSWTKCFSLITLSTLVQLPATSCRSTTP